MENTKRVLIKFAWTFGGLALSAFLLYVFFGGEVSLAIFNSLS